MNKETFLRSIREQLVIYQPADVDDLILNYETQINEEVKEGKTEQEVIESLGPISEIVENFKDEFSEERQYNAEQLDYTKSNNIVKIIFFILLQFFNIIFVVVFISLIVSVASILLVPLIGAPVIYTFASEIFLNNPFTLVFSIFLLIFIISFILLILVLLIRFFKKYLRFNKDLFRSLKNENTN